jgi:hypothetical protein
MSDSMVLAIALGAIIVFTLAVNVLDHISFRVIRRSPSELPELPEDVEMPSMNAYAELEETLEYAWSKLKLPGEKRRIEAIERSSRRAQHAWERDLSGDAVRKMLWEAQLKERKLVSLEDELEEQDALIRETHRVSVKFSLAVRALTPDERWVLQRRREGDFLNEAQRALLVEYFHYDAILGLDRALRDGNVGRVMELLRESLVNEEEDFVFVRDAMFHPMDLARRCRDRTVAMVDRMREQKARIDEKRKQVGV